MIQTRQDFITWLEHQAAAGSDLEAAVKELRAYHCSEPATTLPLFEVLRRDDSGISRSHRALLRRKLPDFIKDLGRSDVSLEAYRRCLAEFGTDLRGDRVTEVYVVRSDFLIYAARAQASWLNRHAASQLAQVRYFIAGTADAAAPYFKRAAALQSDIARLRDIVNGLSQQRIAGWRDLQDQALEQIARALQSAFDEVQHDAKAILDRYTQELMQRRDSFNRMRYVKSNVLALFIILVLWGLLRFLGGDVERLLDREFTIGGTSGEDLAYVHYLDALLFGALGAFFSVQRNVEEIRIAHTITRFEMLFTGFIRIPIGVVAAAVTFALVQGEWLLGGLTPTSKLYGIYVLAFLSGFSETFVPNALKKVETDTAPQHPQPH